LRFDVSYCDIKSNISQQIKEEKVNKFAEWIKNNDKKQCRVAEKVGVSYSHFHDILKKGQMPSLKVAYEIEKYTKGVITVYDWIDQADSHTNHAAKNPTINKIKKKNGSGFS
jgi:transcriptional regulator with XRE-family HTH domain